MSVRVSGWVLDHSEEDVPGRRLVLLVLADKADDDGTNAYPSVDTIARQTRMSRRGVQYALRELEKSGRIRKAGTHPTYGTTEYVVVMGENCTGARIAPAQSEADSMPQIAPEPSSNPSQPLPSAHTRARKPDPDRAPEGFPDELRPVGAEVMAILQRVVDARGGIAPTKHRVGRIVMDNPRKPAVRIAQAVEDWAVHGNGARKQCKDPVARWRLWLVDEQDVLPSASSNGHGPNVIPMRETAGERERRERRERSEERERRLRASGALPNLGGVPETEAGA